MRIVLPAHKPATQQQLHPSSHVFLLEQLHILSVLRLGCLCLRACYKEKCEGD